MGIMQKQGRLAWNRRGRGPRAGPSAPSQSAGAGAATCRGSRGLAASYGPVSMSSQVQPPWARTESTARRRCSRSRSREPIQSRRYSRSRSCSSSASSATKAHCGGVLRRVQVRWRLLAWRQGQRGSTTARRRILGRRAAFGRCLRRRNRPLAPPAWRRHRSCAPLLGSTSRRRRRSLPPHEKLSPPS